MRLDIGKPLMCGLMARLGVEDREWIRFAYKSYPTFTISLDNWITLSVILR